MPNSFLIPATGSVNISITESTISPKNLAIGSQYFLANASPSTPNKLRIITPKLRTASKTKVPISSKIPSKAPILSFQVASGPKRTFTLSTIPLTIVVKESQCFFNISKNSGNSESDTHAPSFCAIGTIISTKFLRAGINVSTTHFFKSSNIGLCINAIRAGIAKNKAPFLSISKAPPATAFALSFAFEAILPMPDFILPRTSNILLAPLRSSFCFSLSPPGFIKPTKFFRNPLF